MTVLILIVYLVITSLCSFLTIYGLYFDWKIFTKDKNHSFKLLPSIKTFSVSFIIAMVVQRTMIENKKVQMGSTILQFGWKRKTARIIIFISYRLRILQVYITYKLHISHLVDSMQIVSAILGYGHTSIFSSGKSWLFSCWFKKCSGVTTLCVEKHKYICSCWLKKTSGVATLR